MTTEWEFSEKTRERIGIIVAMGIAVFFACIGFGALVWMVRR